MAGIERFCLVFSISDNTLEQGINYLIFLSEDYLLKAFWIKAKSYFSV